MSEQQYRVIADRDKGDDPQWTDVHIGDRYVGVATERAYEDDPLVRIEPPVPNTELQKPLNTAIQAPEFAGSLPTREQIAEALYLDDADHEEWSWVTEDNSLTRAAYLKNADAVLALLQKWADR